MMGSNQSRDTKNRLGSHHVDYSAKLDWFEPIMGQLRTIGGVYLARQGPLHLSVQFSILQSSNRGGVPGSTPMGVRHSN